MSKAHLPQLPETISFASELIKARGELRLTQSQLAEKSGVSLSAIKAYEAGRNMPGARELRELCQALEVSPNKLLFGTELPFENRSAANLLVDSEREDDHVSRARATILLSLLASDEREAILTLARSIALARHGEAKVREHLLGADVLAGIGRAMMGQTRDVLQTGTAIDPQKFTVELEQFMERQGHNPDPKKLPKK